MGSKRKRMFSIFVKFSIVLTFFIMVVFTVFGIVLINIQENLLLDEKIKDHQLITELIANISTSPIEKFTYFILNENTTQLQANELFPSRSILSVLIYDTNGVKLNGNGIEQSDIRTKKEYWDVWETEILSTHWDKVIGTLRVVYSLESVYEKTSKTRSIFFGIVILTIFVLEFIVIVLLFFIISRPIRRLTKFAEEIALRNYEGSITIKSNDELRILSDTFNAMVSRIRKDMESQQATLEKERHLTEELLRSNSAKQDLIQGYSRFVPEELLQLLNKKSIVDVKLGDQVQKDMTILFADIRDFTHLSEIMTPKENFDFINSYLRRVGPVIKNNRGFIDKYIGDAIMALFPNSPVDGMRAAIDLLDTVRLFNEDLVRRSEIPIRVGVGMHCGSLMLGTIGESNRMDGTVISDAVNLSSRLENLTKLYKVSIICSNELLKRVESEIDLYSRFLGKVRVKGRKDPVNIYDIFNADSDIIKENKLKTRQHFLRGLDFYYSKDFELAAHYFEKILFMFPEDHATRLYLHRAKQFMHATLNEHWDGIDNLEISL